MTLTRRTAWLGLAVLGLVPWGTVCGEDLGYNRRIRPLLAETCFPCHGPDSASRKAGLRLDDRAAAIKAGAITPGNPDESEAISRILATDASERMPPLVSHKVLTQPQKELLKRWVAAGAQYEPHWAFIAPRRPPLPAVKQRAWLRNPIDAFILSKLEAAGLASAPEADRRTLARRAALDVTGLPPQSADVDAFVADARPDAYERCLDRLMTSPRWGEHRARAWLDAARYADTHGLHFDNYREMWSYRDWVIEAFNRNQPFDQFTLEQLAGDLLPKPTLEQLVATGFNRCNITTNEGGTIPEENLALYTRDRTETFSRVWLGLTTNCAVCHDHKFDPLRQKEFYALSAAFNNTTQGAMDGNIKDTPPIIVVPTREDRGRWEALKAELADAQAKADGRKHAARKDFTQWLAKPDAAALGKHPADDKLHLHAALDEGAGRKLAAQVDRRPQAIDVAGDPQWESGHVAAKAIKVQAKATVQIAAAGDFEKDQAVSFGAWVKLGGANNNGAIFARMDEQNGHRGWDLWAEKGRVGAHIIHQWDDDALKVVTAEPITADRWHHVMATYDGSGKAGGVQVYVDGARQSTRVAADKLKGSIRTSVPLSIGQRARGSRLEQAAIHDVRIYRRALAAHEVQQLMQAGRGAWLATKPAAARTAAETEELFAAWLPVVDRPYQELRAGLATLEKESDAIKARGSIAYVAQEQPTPAKAYVLFRGEYDKRREEVTPNTFACLPPLASNAPKNRLGVALWLLRPDHPLMARVTVNRFWQEVFGQGIVRTTGDFGTTGEMPSHEELLDWLAVEFRESGWDMKRFFRLMLTSAAYRQAATATPEKIAKDPHNILFSRGPRFRMDAEMIRDYLLAASGLLSDKIGGSSVRPYQPPGVWEAVAMIGSNTREYKQDHGESLYRRSMYTFWKRAAPPAAMEIFNAPSREVCAVRRERTNTPLQALAALNDPQLVEAARRLAECTLKEGGATDESRLDFLARRLLARPLATEELAVARPLLAQLQQQYARDPEAAKQLLTVGETPADCACDKTRLASWTMLVNGLMNLDEVLNK